MLAVQYVKSVPRYLVVRMLGRSFPALYTNALSCVRLADVPEPNLPTPHWVKIKTLLSGICGSDLAVITCKGSPYFSPLTSTPFTFGHEVVGEVVDVGSEVTTCRVGERVVIEPALNCIVRGIKELCRHCQAGNFANCENITKGDISPGVQTGYCKDTGGGWSSYLVAHEFQVHKVPDGIPNETAVLIEPFSCALHAALKSMGEERMGVWAGSGRAASPTRPHARTPALVLGCGTMGLLTIAALKGIGFDGKIVAVAKHRQQQDLAKTLGADVVVPLGSTLYAQLCNLTGAKIHQPEFGKPTVIGGFDVTFDCVGSSSTLDDALRLTRAKGKVILVGMPAIPKGVDWTAIWHKELEVIGAYAYGTETITGKLGNWGIGKGERVRTFELAIRILQEGGIDLSALVRHKFRLEEYRRAIEVALRTGKFESVKTVFDFT